MHDEIKVSSEIGLQICGCFFFQQFHPSNNKFHERTQEYFRRARLVVRLAIVEIFPETNFKLETKIYITWDSGVLYNLFNRRISIKFVSNTKR